MKLATCTVSLKGWRKETGNKARINLLKEAIEKAKAVKSDLVCLPAGYLFAKSKQSFRRLVSEIEKIAKEYSIFVAVGIDQNERIPKRDIVEEVIATNIPFLVVCAGPRIKTRIWGQRSSTSDDQYDVISSLCSEARSIRISGKITELLLCGEICNRRIRSSVLERQPDLAVDLAHLSHRFRVSGSMKILAKGGVPTFFSAHVEKRKARKYCYIPGRTKVICKSSNKIDIQVDGPPRLELKFWMI